MNRGIGADGLKTGFTKKSGWGIAASSKRENRRITVVINGTNSSRSRLNESANLMNWAFDQTSQKILVEKGQFIKKTDGWEPHNTTTDTTHYSQLTAYCLLFPNDWVYPTYVPVAVLTAKTPPVR